MLIQSTPCLSVADEGIELLSPRVWYAIQFGYAPPFRIAQRVFSPAVDQIAHEIRRADIGSSPAALRAGTSPETNATAIRNNIIGPYVVASHGEVAKSSDEISRAETKDAAMPATMPIATRRMVLTSTLYPSCSFPLACKRTPSEQYSR